VKRDASSSQQLYSTQERPPCTALLPQVLLAGTPRAKKVMRTVLGGDAVRPGFAIAATHYDEQALLAQRVPQCLDSHPAAAPRQQGAGPGRSEA